MLGLAIGFWSSIEGMSMAGAVSYEGAFSAAIDSIVVGTGVASALP